MAVSLSSSHRLFSVEQFKKEYYPKTDHLYSVYFSIFELIYLNAISLADAEQAKITLAKRVSYLEALSKELISEDSYLGDILDLETKKIPRGKTSEASLLDGLDLDVPLYTAPRVSYCDNQIYKNFHESVSSINLKSKCLSIQKRAVYLKEAINEYYFSCLNSLIYAKNLLGRSIPSEKAFLPSETLNFIQIHLCCPVKPHFLERLGAGSYGAVSRIVLRHTHYAFKKFHKEFEKEGFFYESAVHMCIAPNENIVRINLLAIHGMVLEYEPEGTLLKALEEDRCGYQDLVEIFLCIAKGLDHIHKHGYNFKDLKTNNILVCNADPGRGPLKAKLCDLGFLLPSSFDVDKNVHPLTAAPETIFCSRKSPLTPKSDSWSFGVVLFQMLTGGAQPFYRDKAHHDDYMKIIAKGRSGVFATPEELLKDLNRAELRKARLKDPEGHLLKLAANCLDGRPLRRISMAEVIIHLDRLSQELSHVHDAAESAL